jgi:putative adenylate-forming enzyme
MLDALHILRHFFAARRLSASIQTDDDLRTRQAGGLYRFRREVLKKSPFYGTMWNDHFGRFPMMSKAEMLAQFSRINTVGIDLEQAMETAMKAERSRDFAPMIGEVTIGLSSGTSGRRGIFMASKAERLKWAGVMLAKALPRSILRPHRIAFFLRANSNLYSTLNRGSHLSLDFYDLTLPISHHVATLNANQPDVLTAPASVLRALSEEASRGRLAIRPIRILSVAEVLEPEDATFIAEHLGSEVHQIYQCTEGFLGISGADGRIRLNEEYLIVEKEWVDRKAGRFVPIITDFTRSTQPIVRYRLDDVLVEDLSDTSPFTVLKAIEGRCDDVLHFQSACSRVPICGDTMRQAVASSSLPYDDYRIIQEPSGSIRMQFLPELDASGKAEAKRIIDELARRHGAEGPEVGFQQFVPRDPMTKFRRIQRLAA